MTEEREYFATENFSEHGKTYCYIKCPFCGAKVKAYRWSLAGCGKRCKCGTMFSSFGIATKEVKNP
ncbi:MAG: hypothetical protein LWW75_07805 [Chlorobiales bacterium]|nr:hypothetical protein [Chlorobiales bacterium]